MVFEYKHIRVSFVEPHVLEVQLNRPNKRNALHSQLWKEIGHVFAEVVPVEEEVRVVLLTGSGKVFSAGIDLNAGTDENSGPFAQGNKTREADPARVGVKTLREGGSWQEAWSALNKCNKPVIAAVQNGCFGAALEMICFADIRFCNSDCVFQAPEVDLGIAADIGGNQVFPKIIGNDSFVREVQMSGRKFSAEEALNFGLVSRVLKHEEELRREAVSLAVTIAEKSPMAVLGVKTMLNFTRDHSVDDSLKYSLTWNASMIQTSDIKEAGKAFMMKTKPKFENPPSVVQKSKSESNSNSKL